jgi:hypothetical protein
MVGYRSTHNSWIDKKQIVKKKKHLIGGYIIMFYIDMVLKKLRRKMIRYLSHYH